MEDGETEDNAMLSSFSFLLGFSGTLELLECCSEKRVEDTSTSKAPCASGLSISASFPPTIILDADEYISVRSVALLRAFENELDVNPDFRSFSL